MTDDLQRDLGRLEGQVAAIDKRGQEIKATISRLERQVREIQASINRAEGGWTALISAGTVGAGIATVIVTGIKSMWGNWPPL